VNLYGKYSGNNLCNFLSNALIYIEASDNYKLIIMQSHILNITIHNLPSIHSDNVKSFRHKLQDDRLCGLVLRVPGYRSRGPGSIPGATRFSEKWWVWNEVHLTS
jgi:hypothetical protein